MKHYGDITKLHGWDLPIVDVVTGGSPCQDLSHAGKREGLSGERSGLFFDYIRILRRVQTKFFLAKNVSGMLANRRHNILLSLQK